MEFCFTGISHSHRIGNLTRIKLIKEAFGWIGEDNSWWIDENLQKVSKSSGAYPNSE